jgi:hypothetical protein
MEERVSAVLIVKDEQDLIARCLKSLVGVDEIIVLDTGSTDKTIEIAKANGASVHTTTPIYPFHFAEARNRATALASNDWVISMDADEIVRPGSMRKIRHAIGVLPDATGFMSTFINRPEAHVESFMSNYSQNSREVNVRTVAIPKQKLFRKSAWTWKYRVHEQLMFTKSPVIPDLSQVVIEHMPIADKSKRHGQNIELLKLCVEENPEYTRAWRHLGMELRLRKQWREAIPYLAHYVEKTEESELEKSEVMMSVAICYAEIGYMGDALEWFDMSAATDLRRREPLYTAAWYLVKNAKIGEDLVKASRYLEKTLAIQIEKRPNTHFDAPTVWGLEPKRMLTFCREELARAVKQSQPSV